MTERLPYGMIFEDPPLPEDRSSVPRPRIADRLLVIRKHPGRWIRFHTYTHAPTASQTVAKIHEKHPGFVATYRADYGSEEADGDVRVNYPVYVKALNE